MLEWGYLVAEEPARYFDLGVGSLLVRGFFGWEGVLVVAVNGGSPIQGGWRAAGCMWGGDFGMGIA